MVVPDFLLIQGSIQRQFPVPGQKLPQARVVPGVEPPCWKLQTVLPNDVECEAITLAASRYTSGDRECGYTLQIFSDDPVELYDAKSSSPFRKEVCLFGPVNNYNGFTLLPEDNRILVIAKFWRARLVPDVFDEPTILIRDSPLSQVAGTGRTKRCSILPAW
jgi:hypothetical protein